MEANNRFRETVIQCLAFLGKPYLDRKRTIGPPQSQAFLFDLPEKNKLVFVSVCAWLKFLWRSLQNSIENEQTNENAQA